MSLHPQTQVSLAIIAVAVGGIAFGNWQAEMLGRSGERAKYALSPTAAYCGNGIKEASEECDDGNDPAGGCSPGCFIEKEKYEGAYWACYDGLQGKGDGSCRFPEEWFSQANAFCNSKCGSGGKCGLNSFNAGRPCAKPVEQFCTDSDGENYFTKGKVYGSQVFTWNNERLQNVPTGVAYDYCEGSRLYEARCVEKCSSAAGGSSEMCNYFTYTDCQFGCQDGACKKGGSEGGVSGGSTGQYPVDCTKFVCPNGKTFPRCNEQGMQISYVDNPCRNDNNSGGVSGGSTGQYPVDCTKIVCPDGKTVPRCDEHGMQIPYDGMDGPCRKDNNSGGVSGGSTGEYKSVCGNGSCEAGEDMACPACVNSDPPCLAPCKAGSCPKDCKKPCPTVVCAAPPPNCKYVDPGFSDGCKLGCGILKCANQCEPMVCKDGSKYPRCADDGSTIAYFKDPCVEQKLCDNGRKVGEVFKGADGCNTCKCTQDGIVCTEMHCAQDGQLSVSSAAYTSVSSAVSYSMYDDRNWSVASSFAAYESVSSIGSSHSVEYEDEVRVLESAPISKFSDVDYQTPEGEAANILAERGVIGGFPDGTFRSEQLVNRAEAAKFLLIARFGNVPDAEALFFSDLLPGEWYVKYVSAAANSGIIGGYADGTFRPGQTVNTAEFLKMLSKTFAFPEGILSTYADVPKDAWFWRYAGLAQQLGVFPERTEYLQPERLVTRGEAAFAIQRILDWTSQ